MDLSGGLAKTLLELAPDATVIVDADGKIVFANAQIERTFGYSAAELIGAPVEQLLPARFRAGHPDHRAQFSANPKSRPMGAGLELFGLRKNAIEFPVEISLSPVATRDGLLVVSAIRDATDKKHTERRLIEENRAKTRFLAAASHDLRQPLQTLNLLNRVAMHQAQDKTDLTKVLEGQQRALNSMTQLLASVLDISKLDSGAIIPHVTNVPLDELWTQLRSDFEPQATQNGLSLIFEDESATVQTDFELLKRLLGNLLSNAIRYTRTGTIHVACKPDGEHVRIGVTDTGIGIPPDELEHIFEEFYQVDQGSRRPEGLGLGLSIVKRLAELLGLRIEMSSRVDEGTTFTVSVMRGEYRPSAHTTHATESKHPGGKILIVDDEADVADATKLLLEIEGFEVKIASCREEALARSAEGKPDLIVSDYHLRGGETGAAVVAAVRAKYGSRLPVVFVTGDTAKPIHENSGIENACLLSKPIRGDELVMQISRMLRAATT